MLGIYWQKAVVSTKISSEDQHFWLEMSHPGQSLSEASRDISLKLFLHGRKGKSKDGKKWNQGECGHFWVYMESKCDTYCLHVFHVCFFACISHILFARISHTVCMFFTYCLTVFYMYICSNTVAKNKETPAAKEFLD